MKISEICASAGGRGALFFVDSVLEFPFHESPDVFHSPFSVPPLLT